MASKYDDIYAVAQFGSLSAVLTHALDPDDDRVRAYVEAEAAMLKDGRWRGYRMLFSPKHRLHVGYNFENPKDWFLMNEDGGEVDGPFRAKKSILNKLRVKSSNFVGTGRYRVDPHWALFTRDQAETYGLDSETLPV